MDVFSFYDSQLYKVGVIYAESNNQKVQGMVATRAMAPVGPVFQGWFATGGLLQTGISAAGGYIIGPILAGYLLDVPDRGTVTDTAFIVQIGYNRTNGHFGYRVKIADGFTAITIAHYGDTDFEILMSITPEKVGVFDLTSGTMYLMTSSNVNVITSDGFLNKTDYYNGFYFSTDSLVAGRLQASSDANKCLGIMPMDAVSIPGVVRAILNDQDFEDSVENIAEDKATEVTNEMVPELINASIADALTAFRKEAAGSFVAT